VSRHHRWTEPTPVRPLATREELDRVLPMPRPPKIRTAPTPEALAKVPPPVLTAEENQARKGHLDRLAMTSPRDSKPYSPSRFGPDKAEAIARRWAVNGPGKHHRPRPKPGDHGRPVVAPE
jgi:hypothetical protein